MSTDSPEPRDQTVKRPAARQQAASPAGEASPAAAGGPDGAPNDLNLSPGVIAAICGGLLVLTIIVFAVFSGGDDEGDDAVDAAPGVTTPSGDPASGPTPPPTPRGPKEPVGSPDGPPTDDFNRANGPVGADWVTLGTWEVVDEQLRLTEPLDGASQVSVRDMGASDGTVSAIARTPSGGQMLVFRYADPKNHWRIGPVRSYATWGVFKVVDGKSRLVENTGLSSTSENTTIRVEMDGPSIEIVIDGKSRVTIEDPAHQDATIAGFLATAGGVRGAWDDFFAIPAGGAAPTTAPTTTVTP